MPEENLKLKTRSPETTVNIVRNILHQQGIFTTEHWLMNEDNLPDSMRVSLYELPVGTNGKGDNCKYAAASGYAELLERLQNLILLYGADYAGNNAVADPTYTDKKTFPYEYFKTNHSEILNSLMECGGISDLEDIFVANDSKVEALPYLHLNTNETVYIPSDLVSLSVGSNGMCAGNSAHEALIQGLCEIFERYVLKEIYRNPSISLPVVPDSYLKKTDQWDSIQYIRSKGYDIYVKDCSLGGAYPVVGVLLVKDNKALLNLGACPNFSVAFSRCVSELLQGVDFKQIDAKMQPVVLLSEPTADVTFSSSDKQTRYHYFRSLFCGHGVVPPSFFDHSGEFNEAHIFKGDDLTSEATLADLLRLVEKEGGDVYMRDVSFLGFPSYQIYIPGMSEVLGLDSNRFKLVGFDLGKARRIFFDIDNAGSDEIRLLISVMERVNDEPAFQKQNILNIIFGLTFREKISLQEMAPEILIALLYSRTGEHKIAFEKLHSYLCATVGEEALKNVPEYAVDQACLLALLNELASGNSLDSRIFTKPTRFVSTYECGLIRE